MIRLLVALVTLALAAPALAQQPPPPSVEERLDVCRFERGRLEQEAAQLSHALRTSEKEKAALRAELDALKKPKDAKEPPKK